MEFISRERQDIFIFSLVLCTHENIKDPVSLKKYTPYSMSNHWISSIDTCRYFYVSMEFFSFRHQNVCLSLIMIASAYSKQSWFFSIALINVIEGHVLYEVEQYCPREWFLLARCQPPGPLSSPVSVSKVCSSATGLKQLYWISKCLTTFKLYCLSIVWYSLYKQLSLFLEILSIVFMKFYQNAIYIL